MLQTEHSYCLFFNSSSLFLWFCIESINNLEHSWSMRLRSADEIMNP